MVRLGIIGTGMMACIIAESCSEAGIKLHSVLSRTTASSEKFCFKYGIAHDRGFTCSKDFFSDDELDVVYIATPTSEKEKLLSLCIEFNKHALIEKPFPSTLSMQALLDKANSRHLVWVDAAHYIHTLWYKMLDDLLNEYVGIVNKIRASFSWPDKNTGQLKFDPVLEPYGVAGDLGWYPLRIISKFIPCRSINRIHTILLRDDNNSNVDMSAIGHTDTGIVFMASASYTDFVVQQKFEISGSKGRLIINDFVMPYSGSFVYGTLQPDMRVHVERGMKPLIDKKEIVINILEKQHITMLKHLSEFINNPDTPQLKQLQSECINTMDLLRLIEDSHS
ncbi:Gfo/Idh/MocA family oxidoreductase [Salmonella enterica subsp. diarizonae]|nr:gfo/Idh/MocA family oxidoreductase [Salmonella enterica]ECG8655816.1 Gfo/Idh/MocA family oxidoreductase [Salmonella enterica subsp. diarizonae]EDV3465575.1 Gfo/Idh/MocA family oxidoreductase [Salmonella enterica subsp. diarizonae]EDY1997683.1 Gfo/Idh/MocA family oxidoreductase [Salmonella enterica subsp. diarizonae]